MQLYICDVICGGGKTQAAINMINKNPNARYMYISPFLAQLDRVQGACNGMQQPRGGERESKIPDLHNILESGQSVAITHELFKRLDDTALTHISQQGYVLICDEAINPFDTVDMINTYDVAFAFTSGLLECDTITGQVQRGERGKAYKGDLYKPLVELVDKGNVYTAITNNKTAARPSNTLITMLDFKLFETFQSVYVLTYMYALQPLDLYFRIHAPEVKPHYISTKPTSAALNPHTPLLDVVKALANAHEYEFVDTPDNKPEDKAIWKYGELIKLYTPTRTLCPKGKNNKPHKYTYSKTWYDHFVTASSAPAAEVRQSLRRFTEQPDVAAALRAARERGDAHKTALDYLVATTYNAHVAAIRGDISPKHFIPCNTKATNDYSECVAVAYMVNMHLPPEIINYLHYRLKDQFDTDELTTGAINETFALTEVIQFVYRSAVRNNKAVYVFIPSTRVRTLFENWIAAHTDKPEREQAAERRECPQYPRIVVDDDLPF